LAEGGAVVSLLDAFGLYWRDFKWFIVLLVAVWLVFMGYHYRDLSCKRDAAERESAALKAERAQVEYWQKQAFDKDEALRKALSAPKAAPKIEKVIRANPSRCVVPAPVADGLRDAIREGNAAISK
jgi:hypothetical protein